MPYGLNNHSHTCYTLYAKLIAHLILNRILHTQNDQDKDMHSENLTANTSKIKEMQTVYQFHLCCVYDVPNRDQLKCVPS